MERQVSGDRQRRLAGSINYFDMIRSVSNGYATSSSDTGHQATAIDARWALGHLEKVADYGHRAIHETAVTAKALINAFYGAAPRFSFQFLLERRPAGADGSAAVSRRLRRDRRRGAGAEHHASGAGVRVESAHRFLDPAGHVPARKIPAIATAVVAA